MLRQFLLTVVLVAVTWVGSGECFAATPVIFTDDFNRPDGPVGNGWINSPTNVNIPLSIGAGALVTSGLPGEAGIYRPADYSGAVTATATITQMTGFGGVLDRFATTFVFGGDAYGNGLGISFIRGDANFSDSRVFLLLNGVLLNTAFSTFQFSGSITPTVTRARDGSITGSIAGGSNTFNFSFLPTAGAPMASFFALDQEAEDARSNFRVRPTIDDFSLTTTPVPEPGQWLLMVVGLAICGWAARRELGRVVASN